MKVKIDGGTIKNVKITDERISSGRYLAPWQYFKSGELTISHEDYDELFMRHGLQREDAIRQEALAIIHENEDFEAGLEPELSELIITEHWDLRDTIGHVFKFEFEGWSGFEDAGDPAGPYMNSQERKGY